MLLRAAVDLRGEGSGLLLPVRQRSGEFFKLGTRGGDLRGEFLVLGLRGFVLRLRGGGEFLDVLQPLIRRGDLRLALCQIGLGRAVLLTQTAQRLRKRALLLFRAAQILFQRLATGNVATHERFLRAALFRGGQQLARAFVAILHQRGDRSSDLRFVRFHRFERARGIFEAAVRVAEIGKFVFEVRCLRLQRGDLRFQLGAARGALLNLRVQGFELFFRLRGGQRLLRGEFGGLLFELGQFRAGGVGVLGKFRLRGIAIRQKAVEFGLRAGLLRLQRGELLLQRREALLRAADVGLMRALRAEEGCDGGFEEAVLLFFFAELRGNEAETFLRATQSGDAGLERRFVRFLLRESLLDIEKLILRFGERGVFGLQIVVELRQGCLSRFEIAIDRFEGRELRFGLRELGAEFGEFFLQAVRIDFFGRDGVFERGRLLREVLDVFLSSGFFVGKPFEVVFDGFERFELRAEFGEFLLRGGKFASTRFEG